MSKRRNDGAQMRREEYEAADDGPDAMQGSFRKADTSALSGRKIIKARKRRTPKPQAPAPVAAAAAPAGVKANPFAGFTGLAGAGAAPEPPPKRGPFAGFSYYMIRVTHNPAVKKCQMRKVSKCEMPRVRNSYRYRDRISVTPGVVTRIRSTGRVAVLHTGLQTPPPTPRAIGRPLGTPEQDFAHGNGKVN